MICRPQLRPRQPAHRPLHQPPPARPTASSARASSSTAPSCPTTAVSPCRYRLRLLNVSSFRSYNLQLSNGAADDPDRDRERADAEADPPPRNPPRPGRAGRGDRRLRRRRRGRRVELRSSKRHAGRNPDGARTYGGALMQFRVGSERVPDRTRVPRHLRPLPAWTRKAKRKPDQRWEITIGGFFKTTWRINGRTFNPAHVRGLPEAGHDRDLGDRQQDQRRPRDAPAPHRLVPARAQRQAAAALGRLPQGDVLRLPQRKDPPRRPLLRLHREVRRSTATCSTTRTTA